MLSHKKIEITLFANISGTWGFLHFETAGSSCLTRRYHWACKLLQKGYNHFLHINQYRNVGLNPLCYTNNASIDFTYTSPISKSVDIRSVYRGSNLAKKKSYWNWIKFFFRSLGMTARTGPSRRTHSSWATSSTLSWTSRAKTRPWTGETSPSLSGRRKPISEDTYTHNKRGFNKWRHALKQLFFFCGPIQ